MLANAVEWIAAHPNADETTHFAVCELGYFF